MSENIVQYLTEGDECPNCGATSYAELNAICKARAGNLMCRVCAFTFPRDLE